MEEKMIMYNGQPVRVIVYPPVGGRTGERVPRKAALCDGAAQIFDGGAIGLGENSVQGSGCYSTHGMSSR